MAVEVVMPRLGWTMETGTVAEWLKQDGDPVQAGDVIFTVENDKALQEVEALDGGILRIPPTSTESGLTVPVGTVLAYLVQPGEDIPFERLTAHAPSSGVSDQTAEDTATASAQTRHVDALTASAAMKRLDGKAAPAISPRARRVARELGVDWTRLTGSGRSGRIVERDVRAGVEQATRERTRVTPLARRLAAVNGVDLAEIEARQPGQRIMRSDVEAAAPRPVAETPAPDGRRIPLAQVRRIVSARMAQSMRTTAPVTLTTEADATELVLLRTRLQTALAGSARPIPSYNDLLARLVALALQQHPALNSSLEDDALIQHEAVHLGIAVDTERGLLVPVVRDAHAKSIQQIAVESARLIAQARTGQANAADLQGGTFTITNLGMYEIDAFTPIINVPECAILGVGRILARPVVLDEETEKIAVRKMMALSLTFDHRAVDGAPAARFLQQVKRWIEQPYAWLTE